MPEGPEAHTVATDLHQSLAGRYILNIEVLSAKASKNCEACPVPALIKSVGVHGKRPIFCTNRGFFLTFLGMQGRWLYEPEKHTRIILTIGHCQDHGGCYEVEEEFKLYFDDVGFRVIASVEYFPEYDGILAYTYRVGPDVLSDPPTLGYFSAIAWLKFRPTKTLDLFLLAPESNCTVGNYLKSDILWYAQLSPLLTIGDLTDERMYRLWYAMCYICHFAYSKGGHTERDYLRPDGSIGGYRCLVYHQEVDPYGRAVEAFESKDKRMTFWVPSHCY
jgi:formamidopyrimidine-DNA glycosylase